MLRWPKQAKIVEVGPRDGLQAESLVVPIEMRAALIESLVKAGLKSIEVGSLVSPRWVPQMAESEKVFKILHKRSEVSYSMLVPNKQGFEKAKELGVKDISIFTAASETFANKNINCSIEESYNRFAEFLPAARKHGIRVRGYVSCVVSCPYEGMISPNRVSNVVENLLVMGCNEISLGDTTGAGAPGHIETLLETLAAPPEKLAVHFHDTYGQALSNILIALERGISTIDASASGLGGCPYAPGASGNVATEDVLYMLNSLGVETGIQMNSLIQATTRINDHLQRTTGSALGCVLGKTEAHF